MRGLDRASRCAEIADRALIALLKIIAECRRSEDVKAYSVHPRILARLKPGQSYSVQIGFGLHVGWAIEGPIGSDFKIDASYLSPHVNVTMNLEGGTKPYGCMLLMSEPYYVMLSLRAKEKIRKVDVVKYSETDKPAGIFTFDIVPWFDGSVDTPALLVDHQMGDCLQPEGYEDLKATRYAFSKR